MMPVDLRERMHSGGACVCRAPCLRRAFGKREDPVLEAEGQAGRILDGEPLRVGRRRHEARRASASPPARMRSPMPWPCERGVGAPMPLGASREAASPGGSLGSPGTGKSAIAGAPTPSVRQSSVSSHNSPRLHPMEKRRSPMPRGVLPSPRLPCGIGCARVGLGGSMKRIALSNGQRQSMSW